MSWIKVPLHYQEPKILDDGQVSLPDSDGQYLVAYRTMYMSGKGYMYSVANYDTSSKLFSIVGVVAWQEFDKYIDINDLEPEIPTAPPQTEIPEIDVIPPKQPRKRKKTTSDTVSEVTDKGDDT